jgi:hypothetical protein
VNDETRRQTIAACDFRFTGPASVVALLRDVLVLCPDLEDSQCQ